MGQKINPIGLRLGINRGWDSTWFAKKKDFGKYLIEDFKIRNYIKKNIVNSGVSEIIIERSSKKCTVSIHTSRPGFVIGKILPTREILGSGSSLSGQPRPPPGEFSSTYFFVFMLL